MSEWAALVARVTLFPLLSSSPLPSALDLYRHVWSREPDNFQRQANPLMPSVAQGKAGSIVANCTAQRSRIDFNLAPVAPTDGSLALISDVAEVRDGLSRIIEAIERDAISVPVVRAAIFLHFARLAATLWEANKLLLESMPTSYRMGVTDEEDFIFQVNKPLSLAEDGSIHMNSVTKWSADRIQVFNLPVSMGGPASWPFGQAPMSFTPTEFLIASVTFDHNNKPGHTPINSKQQVVLLTEGLNHAARVQREYGMNIVGF